MIVTTCIIRKSTLFTSTLITQVDSKKELEKALKATCEAFIMGATKATVEDMLSFITKVTAVKVVSAAANAKPLREQVLEETLYPTPMFCARVISPENYVISLTFQSKLGLNGLGNVDIRMQPASPAHALMAMLHWKVWKFIMLPLLPCRKTP